MAAAGTKSILSSTTHQQSDGTGLGPPGPEGGVLHDDLSAVEMAQEAAGRTDVQLPAGVQVHRAADCGWVHWRG